MSDSEGKFSTIEEERDYYKELAMKFKMKFEETNMELEEFQESSREFEAELEAQLEQTETRNRELNTALSRLRIDYEILQEKFQKNQFDSRKQVLDLEEELSRVKVQRDDLQKYIRELEQLNDDLERAKRATVSSLEDFEARLNQAIERNAFLESELDEKEALKVMVQRLKDESRDLRQEMTVHQVNKPVYDGSFEKSEKSERISTNGVDSNKIQVELQDSSLSPLKSPVSSIAQMSTGAIPFTPSSRITALNIVADLLRKVGALESKLASCRIYVKENSPKTEKEENGTGLGSPVLSKRLSKSSLSSPSDSISLIA